MILVIYALMSGGVSVGTFAFNIWQALPYFIVLGMSVLGINVFLVLITGILLFILVGIFTGSLTYATALASMGSGISGMFETMIVTILVASIAALMKENGGFEAILAFIRGDHPLWRAAAGGSQYREADECFHDPFPDLSVCPSGVCGRIHSKDEVKGNDQ